MEEPSLPVKAALLLVLGAHEGNTTLHEATIFQHARRLALRLGPKSHAEGEQWVADLARSCDEEDFVAIYAAVVSETVQERVRRYWTKENEPRPAP